MHLKTQFHLLRVGFILAQANYLKAQKMTEAQVDAYWAVTGFMTPACSTDCKRSTLLLNVLWIDSEVEHHYRNQTDNITV